MTRYEELAKACIDECLEKSSELIQDNTRDPKYFCFPVIAKYIERAILDERIYLAECFHQFLSEIKGVTEEASEALKKEWSR